MGAAPSATRSAPVLLTQFWHIFQEDRPPPPDLDALHALFRPCRGSFNRGAPFWDVHDQRGSAVFMPTHEHCVGQEDCACDCTIYDCRPPRGCRCLQGFPPVPSDHDSESTIDHADSYEQSSQPQVYLCDNCAAEFLPRVASIDSI